MPQPPAIPIPLQRRLHRFRTKALPVLTFLLAVAGVAYLWDRELAPSGMVGEVHGASSEITAPDDGTIEQLALAPFTRVQAGDLVGYLRKVPAENLQAAIAVLRAEIELTRLGSFDPILDKQRNELDLLALRQDFLAARADLASKRINRARAQREFERFNAISAGLGVSESELDRLRAEYESLAAEEEGLVEQVEALESAIHHALPDSGEMASLPDTIQATLAWQQSRLEQIEAESARVPIRAPTTGIVVRPLRASGQFVAAGDTIAMVRSETPEYIVGYIPPPVTIALERGMEVDIIPRGNRAARVRSEITAIGTEFEALGPIFHGPFSAVEERALPIRVEIPPGMQLRPGELVDLRLVDSRG